MDSQQFSLCWDNFHVNMSSGMHSLLEKEDLVDVTLAIEGQYLKAHKMVLSVCSPYFRKLFSTNPCKHPIFFMKDVTYEVMNDLLTFMYQGEVQVNQENLATFIKTAEALQIKGLTGENREVDDALKEVNSLKRPPPFPDEPRNRLNRSKPISAKKIKTTQETQDLQRDESYIEQTSDSMQLKVEPNEQVEDAESYGWPDDSYLNETENLPDDSQVDEAEECHMMEEEPKPGTSLEGAIPNQECKRKWLSGKEFINAAGTRCQRPDASFTCGCSKAGCMLVTLEQKRNHFDAYHQLTFDEQTMYLMQRIILSKPARRRITTSRRFATFKYKIDGIELYK
ncbi:PREDICTED: modifier of mdg4-like isoform X5 [Nicrophorus vespilloides]|uniref:Modifier of mdg4-like isoform X5 n=1 Tax=Nicrophorus vespilloides TaxID=110193 RepID=A0ABM1MWA0_NICVS|nr:PREDICTED: modifier of mdg4-like isoform X5 [Nicrophorus vespilloides]